MQDFPNLAHTGICPTLKSVSDHYVWHGMRKDIADFVSKCKNCQMSKIGTHESHPVRQFMEEPTGKFTHVHVDIVGPLPMS